MIIDLIEPTDDVKKLLFINPLNSLNQVKDIIDN